MAERKAFLLRIDPDLWAGLERLAQSELRSVNSQVNTAARRVARRGIRRRPGRGNPGRDYEAV